MATGSARSVYEDIEWIARLKDFIRRLHAARKPYVGICFGHQALAEALGGRVAKAPQGWGVGIRAADLLRVETWMQPRQARVALQYMHQDQVLELPAGSVLLAAAAHCPVAAFRVGETMLGIQAHPEFPREYSRALIKARRERISAARADEALASLSQPSDESSVNQWIIRFLAEVRK
jgi:GMP synthase-like glutamine amidotransferase